MTSPTAPPAAPEESTYIDYESFLDASFSPYSFANTLIASTNDPSDPQLDLSTPLSRVLFDLQEIDTHIHSLTTSSAQPLLSYTRATHDASSSILGSVEAQVATLQKAYERLQKDVVARSRSAEEVLAVVERLHAVTAQLREIGRALVLARQLEVQIGEFSSASTTATSSASASSHSTASSPTTASASLSADAAASAAADERIDWKALVRAAYTLRELSTGGVLATLDDRVDVARTLKTSVFAPAETLVLSRARDAVAEFEPVSASAASANGSGGFAMAQAAVGPRRLESMKARCAAGALALYLLSSMAAEGGGKGQQNGEEEGGGRLLTSVVQGTLNAAVNASLTALGRSLTSLTSLDKAVAEVAARCRNLVALQTLLEGVAIPDLSSTFLPSLSSTTSASATYSTYAAEPSENGDGGKDTGKRKGLLGPVLARLDTPALATSFFRSVAAGLEPRVRDVLVRGGANARILRGAKDKVRAALRACVERGLEGRGGEFEVAVMVGSVGALGR